MELKQVRGDSEHTEAEFLIHDILNYINLINNSVQYMDAEFAGKSDPKNKKVYEKLFKRGLFKLNELCLTYRELILKRHQVKVDYVNLDELISEVLFTISHNYDLSEYYIEKKYSTHANIKVDKVLFSQCLLNIFKNAVENQEESDKRISIEYSDLDRVLKISNSTKISISKPFEKRVGQRFICHAIELMGYKVEFIDLDLMYIVRLKL